VYRILKILGLESKSNVLDFGKIEQEIEATIDETVAKVGSPGGSEDFAFPHSHFASARGLTIRDWFAAHAPFLALILPEDLSQAPGCRKPEEHSDEVRAIRQARWAYQYADAMLRHRGVPK